MSAIEDERLLRRYGEVQERIVTLVGAEEVALHSPMSRQERACRKATRDAYRLVLDLMRNE